MTLSEELTWRGFKNQTTFKDLASLDEAPLTFYWGVDPSADSMTIGNLAAAMMVRHFINYGHKAVLLVGGATGLIGDPDGKRQERDLKSREEVDRNIEAIAHQYKTIFAGQSFDIVNNYDWFKGINYLEFLRDVGKHMSMTQLLDREFVQSRIGEGGAGISYAEFSYSLIQGYDFLHLFRERGVTLQLSGADQWGNSLSGVEMIRKLEAKEAHVYTTPLIVNKTTGAKFGKSEAGAVWLDPNKTSIYQFYQFWLNLGDDGVVDYLKIFTLLSKDAIEDLAKQVESNPGERAAQKALAYEVTKLVHGEKAADMVTSVTEVLFSSADASSMSSEELKLLAAELPSVKSTEVVEALVEAGLSSSRGEARRFVEAGAISVNGQKATLETDLAAPALIRRGKNQFALKTS
ncbi:MAG TPA: tyrosine--tRNA ligase [Candidatus Saccharimonadales bacterium]|nr:tyrosine--tRNA ligase [Candidatus Saccharimonadales bacterium]